MQKQFEHKLNTLLVALMLEFINFCLANYAIDLASTITLVLQTERLIELFTSQTEPAQKFFAK